MKSKPKNETFFNDEKQLANYLLKDFNESFKQAIKMTVQVTVKEEMKKLREEMEDKVTFNGSYPRNMLSPLGKIESIPIPRFREKPVSQLDLNSMNVFDGQKDNFLKIVSEMHQLGISQRKVAKLCQNCFGIKVSKNRVGLVHKELAKKEEFQINSQPLEDQFEYLLLDGLWVKCKGYGFESDDNKGVLLCALGITKEGERKIVGFKFARSEDYENWHDFLLEIKQRGLLGKNLKLIITDDNGGLVKAIKHLYPDVKTQVCITHKLRNVIAKTSHKNKVALSQDVKKIYQAETKEEAEKRAKDFSKDWYVREESSIKSLKYNFEKTLTYYDFPKEDWKKIRTTNILEREFREVRRRIKVFDNSFDSKKSVNTYGNSIFGYLNNHYPESYTQ